MEFFLVLFRLRGWDLETERDLKRPSVLWNTVNKLIFDLMDRGFKMKHPGDLPDVLKNWQKVGLKNKDVPALFDQYVEIVAALMRAATSWRQLETLLARAFPEVD